MLNPTRVRRFVQEAKAASALRHPNIITIHDVDIAETADGSRVGFIAMEHVDGSPLDRLIAKRSLATGEVLSYGTQLAEALAAAHAAGITHRDVKPANIIVSNAGISRGVIKVLDFGPEHWRRERITFDSPYGVERVIAWLYLPKAGKPPFHAVLYFPGATALDMTSSQVLQEELYFDYVVRSGRAVIHPINQDTYERRVVAAARCQATLTQEIGTDGGRRLALRPGRSNSALRRKVKAVTARARRRLGPRHAARR